MPGREAFSGVRSIVAATIQFLETEFETSAGLTIVPKLSAKTKNYFNIFLFKVIKFISIM